jgi:PAS domain S-box-containing protein
MGYYGRALDTGEVQFLEYPMDVNGQPQQFEARVVRHGPDTTLTIVRNVTEALRTRERLAMLGAAIEQAAEDVIITDAAGVIRYVNPTFERTTGWGAAEVVGKTPAVLKSGLHDDAFYRELWQSLAAGRPWHGRFTNRTRDGRLILQDATVVAIRDAAGAVVGYVSTRADVTRRVEMESQLAHSQRMEAIGTLAGGIAHDFNNILAAIMGNAELALDAAGPAGPAADELRSILDASQRAADLVRRILAFSRQTAEEARPVPVAALVAESLKLLRSTLPKDVLVVPRLAGRALVLADAGELQRVLLNLCTNAAHAMREGGGTLTVGLTDEVLDEAAAAARGVAPGLVLHLTVADTGCGMTPEVKARVFEPFFTTRPFGEGTGLGLSIVHGVVKRLGGAIHVESAPGAGTTFEIWLPALAEGTEADAAGGADAVRGEGRLLVIDDEPMLVEVLERSLSRLGYRVRAFTSPLEALRVLEAAPAAWDAVVTDLAMPQLSGEEVARRVRALRPGLPVFVCTGNRRELDDEAAAALGVAEVLEKPVRASELSAALGRHLVPVA